MTYESYMAESEYLQHHGVLGMKWGVRRYQPYPDNYRGDGKFLGKRERQLSRTQDRIERSVAKARKAAEKGDVKALNKYNKRTERLSKKEQKQIKRVDKARARYEKNAEINAQMEAKEKERLLSKGSTQELVESLGKYDYTDAELNRAAGRINAEVKISSLMDAEKNAKYDKMATTLSKITDVGRKAIGTYDTYVSIASIVNKATGKDTMPIPGAKKAKEKRDIIRSVDYNTIMKNRSKLSPDEFAEAMKSVTSAAGAKKVSGEAMSKFAEGVKAERALAKEAEKWDKEDKEKATAIAKAEALKEDKADVYDYGRRKVESLVSSVGSVKVSDLDSMSKKKRKEYKDSFVYDFSKRKLTEIAHSDISEDFLEHHGIKGQHWGVKNGPPYPLGKKTHDRIVKGKNERARVTAEEYRKLRKKKGQKKEGITHLAAPNERFWQEVVTASNLSRPMQVAEMLKSGEHDYLKRLDRPGHRVTEADMKDVNYSRRHNENEYGNNMNDPGLSNNCAKCSASLFLRSLGYDVQAGRSAHGALTSAGQNWFDGAVPYKEKSISNLQRRLESFGNKGKGMLGCRRADGSGHSIYFQNEKGEDGKYHPVIYDGQIAKRYTSLADLFEAESFDETQFSTITRLDNATPNWDHLAEDSVSRMNYSNDNLNSVRNTKDGRQYLANNFRYT